MCDACVRSSTDESYRSAAIDAVFMGSGHAVLRRALCLVFRVVLADPEAIACHVRRALPSRQLLVSVFSACCLPACQH